MRERPRSNEERFAELKEIKDAAMRKDPQVEARLLDLAQELGGKYGVKAAPEHMLFHIITRGAVPAGQRITAFDFPGGEIEKFIRGLK